MTEFIMGVVLAIVIAAFAKATKFEKEPGFYSTVLIVIASYYVLFAFMASEAIVSEIVIASLFSIVAIVGALRWPMLLGVGILLHGIFDFAHGSMISNSGVPVWWPAFCAGVDIVLGIWVMYLAQTKIIKTITQH